MSDDVSYWVDSRPAGEVLSYWKLVGGQDYLLRDGVWREWDLYKSGPSWWRLTGEIGIARIPIEELPPGLPR